jgi:phosphoenolpyruvate-protein kinase (PTS system EI component)
MANMIIAISRIQSPQEKRKWIMKYRQLVQNRLYTPDFANQSRFFIADVHRLNSGYEEMSEGFDANLKRISFIGGTILTTGATIFSLWNALKMQLDKAKAIRQDVDTREHIVNFMDFIVPYFQRLEDDIAKERVKDINTLERKMYYIIDQISQFDPRLEQEVKSWTPRV